MDGVLVVDKPEGLTSHDVVAVARRALRETRVGHTGTLDPLATGVLPLAVGRATRLVRFLVASDKDYDATIRFGLTTDSYDITGTETSRSALQPDRDAVLRALSSLTGTHPQVPPVFSAKKVGGRRAYDLARRPAGAPVELAPVAVTLSKADLVAFDGATARVALTCSAGFYVRSLAHSLGEQVGTGACLETLRRTRSGEFQLGSAVTIEDLQLRSTDAVERLVPLERLLAALPSVQLTDDDQNRVAHGREVQGAAAAPWVRLLDPEGRLIAVARPGSSPGSLHPAVVLI